MWKINDLSYVVLGSIYGYSISFSGTGLLSIITLNFSSFTDPCNILLWISKDLIGSATILSHYTITKPELTFTSSFPLLFIK